MQLHSQLQKRNQPYVSTRTGARKKAGDVLPTFRQLALSERAGSTNIVTALSWKDRLYTSTRDIRRLKGCKLKLTGFKVQV